MLFKAVCVCVFMSSPFQILRSQSDLRHTSHNSYAIGGFSNIMFLLFFLISYCQSWKHGGHASFRGGSDASASCVWFLYWWMEKHLSWLSILFISMMHGQANIR